MFTKFNFTILFLSLLCSCSKFHIQKGEAYLDRNNYPMAISHFNAALRKRSNINVELMLAQCYAKTGQLELATKYYGQHLYETKFINPEDQMDYIRLLMEKGNYQEAQNQLNHYTNYNYFDIGARFLYAICKTMSRENINYPLPFLRNYWTGSQSFNNLWIKDLYLTKNQNQYLGSTQYNFPFWLSPLYMRTDIHYHFENGANCQNEASNLQVTALLKRPSFYNNGESNTNQIVYAIYAKNTLPDGEKIVRKLPFNGLTYSCTHPWLSADGSFLLFISDMPKGYGGTDIYCSYLIDGNWSNPVNLGPEINTMANEYLPYFSDNGSLYFCRDDQNGLYSYITTQHDHLWLKPIPLQQQIGNIEILPINQYYENRFIHIIPNQEAKGKSLVFRFFGYSRWFGTQKIIEGASFLIDKIGTSERWELIGNEKGEVNFLLEGNARYVVYASYDGAFSKSDTISTIGLTESSDFKAEFNVVPIELDKPIRLNTIYYDYNKFDLRKDAIEEMERLVQLLKDNPKLVIEIGSHTDSRGSSEYNLVLSQNRAQSVVSYLVSKGIDTARLTARGYGESMLLNACSDGVKCTEEEHQLNRRTEFTVRKM